MNGRNKADTRIDVAPMAREEEKTAEYQEP